MVSRLIDWWIPKADQLMRAVVGLLDWFGSADERTCRYSARYTGDDQLLSASAQSCDREKCVLLSAKYLRVNLTRWIFILGLVIGIFGVYALVVCTIFEWFIVVIFRRRCKVILYRWETVSEYISKCSNFRLNWGRQYEIVIYRRIGCFWGTYCGQYWEKFFLFLRVSAKCITMYFVSPSIVIEICRNRSNTLQNKDI